MPINISSIIHENLRSDSDGIKIMELEVRFQGFMRTQLFHNFLLRRYDFSSPEFSQSIIYGDNFRTVDSVLWKKEPLHEIKDPLSRFKLSISSEELVDGIEVESLSSIEKIRKRSRRHAKLSENVSLVLTVLNESEYEIEVETEISRDLLKNNFDSDNIDNIVKEFFSVFDDFFANVAEPYYNSCKDFLEKFNKRVPHMSGTMDPFVLGRPRNFKIKDFTTYKEGVGIDSGYTITVKGDGKNTVLFISKGKVLCAARPTEKYFEILTSKLDGYGPFTSVYVGEETVLPTGIKLFTVFDILFDSRNPSIPLLANHLERIKLAKEYSKPFHSGKTGIKFYFKEFFPIGNTPETFAAAYKKAIKDATSHPFGNDGFILTPIYTLHNPVDPKKLKMEGHLPLGKESNLCKIKPASQMSIDFIPTRDHRLICDYGVVFNGTDDFPFDPETNVDWESIPESDYGKVVEFIPDLTKDFPFLTYKHVRTDKVSPNTEYVAKEDWEDIINPVTPAVFLNEDYTRMRRQNQRVKTDLIAKYPDQCIIVDIGMGQGADLYKYQTKAVKVICIEPDLKNRTELFRRIGTLKSSEQNKFIVLNVGGEDSNAILDTYISVKRQFPNSQTVVSAMLSLTFFWQSRKFLDSLLQTIGAINSLSPNTKFGFMVVDGTRFLKMFDSQNKIRERGLQADYRPNETGGISIPGMIKIKMDNTILRRAQYEYLVNLSDMLPDVSIDWFKEAVIERYLSQKERQYAQTHIYGIGTVKGNYNVSKMLRIRSTNLGSKFSSSRGKLKFIDIGSGYYRIMSDDPLIVEGDVLSNFLTVLVDSYENDPERHRKEFYNDFIESLSQPDPRYPGKRIKELYSGQDPLTLFPSSLKLPSNARLYTLSRGRFQNEFFKTSGKKSRLDSDSPIDIIKSQLDSESPSILLYLMIADYLEISIHIIDGLSDMLNYEPLFEERWVSLPKSYVTVLMITDEDSDKIYPVGERGLDGKVITRFVN